MSKTSSSEGTKIAQAAKELNVTSVTIRRYLSEFNIETSTDENGVKVLPESAMEELQVIRQLKEDGLTNPKVLEHLEERRAQPQPARARGKDKPKGRETAQKASARTAEREEETGETEEPAEQPARRPGRQPSAARAAAAKVQAEPVAEPAEEDAPPAVADLAAAGRSKHTLTCQTCGKVFEHMNPRLRDCLDCYRTKRKERRRGGTDKHKNVIQHPVVQQVIAKTSLQQAPTTAPAPLAPLAPPAASVPRHSGVRNYRKAIEETRLITASLKRRLERPDLPEGDRRWLEQIYAYQLILHQGWRHLAEYKAGGKQEAKMDQ